MGVATQDWPQAALAEARKAMQINARDSIDAGRALELLSQLAEFVYSLDQVAWRTWKHIAPNSMFRRPRDLSNTIGRFASGDSAVGREQLANEVKMLRQLHRGALIGTHSAVGRIAVQCTSGIFPPTKSSRSSAPRHGSKEAACWQKYTELYGAMDAGNTEDAVRRELAEFAEKLIQGAR